MGRIRTRDIKQAAAQLRETYPEKFSNDFETNKQALDELNVAVSKRMRNKVAGYITRLAVRRS